MGSMRIGSISEASFRNPRTRADILIHYVSLKEHDGKIRTFRIVSVVEMD
jgi:hypothetical protein